MSWNPQRLVAVTVSVGALCALSALCVVGTPTGAWAQPAPDAINIIARNHYDNASQYYTLHRFDDAAREFQAAYDITHRVELLFNLGRALEDGGHLEDALAAYTHFMDGGAPGVNAPDLRTRIEALRARISVHTAPQTAAQTVTVPAHPRVTTPGGAQAAAPHPVPVPGAGPGRGVPIGLMVGGGVALATGLVLGATVLAASSDVSSHCPDPAHCSTAYQGEADGARTRGLVGDIVGLAGLASVTVGVILWATGHHAEPAVATPQPVLAVTPAGALAGVRLAF